MIQKWLKSLTSVVAGSLCVILAGCNGDNITQPQSKNWTITQKNNILEISYGNGANFPQYATLHLTSSYFRMNYGPNSGWGTSVVLLPSFWSGGKYYQGSPVSATWKTEGENLVISRTGVIYTLNVRGEVYLFPPDTDSFSATVSINVDGSMLLDNRPGESFKPVFLSSMHISENKWDTQSAFVGTQSLQIFQEGWFITPSIKGTTFGLKEGNSEWKRNSPTIEVILKEPLDINGWVTKSSDPNDDNVGFWAASNNILNSWVYTVKAMSLK